ncbi:hypothetical protein DERP_005195 [Dermatophagoides pteronyssinus]|uniref:Uncharacterized protein n=1 Tax=Dermatophagoides pteronyssinus TaxID=6956 RepID=A0ABQ8JME8_DERPT|nr:hypothetical protein DERP_005195 [Dermatophagoides pteronyssinus]
MSYTKTIDSNDRIQIIGFCSYVSLIISNTTFNPNDIVFGIFFTEPYCCCCLNCCSSSNNKRSMNDDDDDDG